MSCCKKNNYFCLLLTLFRCPLITENNHLLRDPELSNVTRNCQIYIMQLDTLKTGIYKLKDFMNCIKVKRNNLFNSIYSSVSSDFRFKETRFVNFFTDPELSSSLYDFRYIGACFTPQPIYFKFTFICCHIPHTGKKIVLEPTYTYIYKYVYMYVQKRYFPL